MRYFRYVEPGWADEVVTTTMSEEQILQEYWAYWKRRMEEVGRHDLISEENCIQDFVVVNWAWEVEP